MRSSAKGRLRLLLCPLGVPYRIEGGGKLQRARDDETERKVDSTGFLAQMRGAGEGSR